MARRGGRRGRRRSTRTARGRRAANRAKARARAQASARKRVSARKAAGKKPSGANQAANRAAAKARAQAAAKKRIAEGKTISQTKAANTASMRKAAAERNRVFQQKKAAEAAARKQTPSPTKTFSDAKNTIQNKNLIASSMSAGSYGGYVDAGDARGFVSPEQAERMLKNPEAYKMRPSETRYLRQSMGLPLASAGNLTNLGIGQEKTYFKVKDPASYGVKSPDTLGRDVSFGPVRDGDTYAKNITNYGMKFGGTPEARGKAYEQTLNPKSFKGLSDGQTFGVGPVASGDAYARGLNTDNKNVENRLRQVRNVASTLTGGLIPSVRKLTDKEIADRRTKVAAQRQANFMGRRTGGSGGGVSRIQQQAAATELLPEIAPTIGQPISQTGAAPMDNSELTRIQSQAYNTQLTSSLAGMFGGQGSVGYTPQGSPELSPTLRAGQSRGRRRVRLFGARRRRGGTGDQFSRAGDRIARLTNINI